MTQSLMHPDPNYWPWRIFNTLLVLALLSIVPLKYSFIMISVMGPGHALLAWWYQLRAGKYADRRKTAVFLAIMAVSFTFGIYHPLPFIFFVAVCFALHNFLDDVQLFNATPTTGTDFFVLYGTLIFGLQITDLMGLQLVAPFLPELALGLPICLWLIVRNRFTPQFPFMVYMFLVCAGVLGLTALFGPLNGPMVFFYIVITHYLNWYGYLYQRMTRAKNHPVGPRKFVRHVVVCHLVFISIMAFCIIFRDGQEVTGIAARFLFFYLFSSLFFHAWTFMHLVTTVRRDDFSLKFRR